MAWAWACVPLLSACAQGHETDLEASTGKGPATNAQAAGAATGVPLGAFLQQWRKLLCTKPDHSYNCACSGWYNPEHVDCSTGGATNECAAGTANCSVHATCTDTATSFSCACNKGYRGDGVTCADIDECLSAPCDVNATCANSDGGFSCACGSGYSGDGSACSDIDECAQNTDHCDAIAVCANTAGGYTCACPAGYQDTRGDGSQCESLCSLAACDAAASCAIEQGAAVCHCPAGTVDVNGNGSACQPETMCQALHCDAAASCMQVGSALACVCPSGYTDVHGDGSQCVDVDECTAGTAGCGANAICTNVPGSFSCACISGYRSTSGGSCSDIDECNEGTANCSASAACSNSAGSFSCACRPGYTGNGVSCTDVDECSNGTANCAAGATCVNTPGSFSCGCASGYMGDGVTCTDIDECSNGTANCSGNANCTNTAGSFGCACKPGFSGNGVTCPDSNECTAGTANCGANATCTNTAGSFSCACNAGYSGNGVTCTDINECTAGTANCGANATCTNTTGGFSCACNAGYTGNGVTCTPVGQVCPSAVVADAKASQRTACTYQAGATATTTLDLTSSEQAAIPIEHVIVMMKENRSYDHYFAKLSQNGQPAAEALPSNFSNLDARNQTVLPFHQTTTCIHDDPGHQWTEMHNEVNGGRMDGFVKSAANTTSTDGHFVMSYYQPADMPFYYFLANTFALADRYFASVRSGTAPNRDYLLLGTSDGVMSSNSGTPSASLPTVFDRLDAKGVSWGVYTDFDPFEGCLGWTSTHVGVHSFASFKQALAAGTLPAVAFVDSQGDVQDEHPTADVQVGEAWTRDVYQSVLASPLWPTTALIFTYDEAGGFFDHVPPPNTCVARPQDSAFFELGVRVPTVVISPYARRHYVSHVVHEHTSILRFIETVFDLPALTARDANSDALLDMFDFACPPQVTVDAAPAAGTGGCH